MSETSDEQDNIDEIVGNRRLFFSEVSAVHGLTAFNLLGNLSNDY